MTVFRLLRAVIAGGAVLGFAAPANATPPEHFSDSGSGTEVFAQCDGFDLILAGAATVRGTRFFNTSGELVRVIVHVRGEETYTNSVTGKTVVNRAVFTDFFTRIRGTDEFSHTVSGFDFQAKVDGRGPLVLQDVGRKLFMFDPESEEEVVVSRSGHLTLPEGSEVDAVLCAAVS